MEWFVPRVLYKNREQVREAVFDRYMRSSQIMDTAGGGSTAARTLVKV